MAKDDAKIVDVEKTERSGDDAASAALQLAILGPFAALTHDPGGTEYTVTLDDGRVGHGSNQEDAIKDAYKK
jgi:hypothetical protein